MQANWLGDLTQWLKDALLWLINSLWQMVHDGALYLLQFASDAAVALFSSIPVPDFIAQHSLGALLGNTGSTILYFLILLQIPAGLSFIAAGYVFRLLRKLVTLGQW